MANMSYCRFENTCSDLKDCIENINDVLTKREHTWRKRLIEMAHEITEMFPPEDNWQEYLSHEEMNPEEEE